MKQREWMGYAAAVLAAGAFLAGCGNIRKLVKSDPEVGVHLPARSAQNPVAQAADTARTQKIITYRKQDGTELFITPVDVDSLSGEKMMSVAIDEVVISASNRRNLVERNGKINVEFVVSVPQELQARNWQLVVDPQLLKGADTLAFDPLVYSGDRFRTMQRREYARYDDYLGRIVDSADYFERFGDKRAYSRYMDRVAEQRTKYADAEARLERMTPEEAMFDRQVGWTTRGERRRQYARLRRYVTHAKENILSWPRSVELKNYLDVGAAMSYCPRNRGGYASEYPSWELFCSFLCTDGLPIDESPLFDPQNPFKNRDPRCTATIVEFGTEHVGVIYNPNPNISRVWSAIAGKEITNLDCKTGSQYASYNGLLRKKGVDELWINDGTFKVDPDFVFIRYGEVLLTYAEAKIEANDIDQSVLDAINQVRARAYKKDYAAATGYPKVTTQDRDKLRQIVRIERRMELAFEGSIRYMDIIRWKLAEKVLNLPNYGLLDKDELINKVVNKNKWFFPYTPEIDEDGIADFTPMYNEGLIKIIVQRNFDTAKNYLWPIPSQEIITNPNLGQNDNY